MNPIGVFLDIELDNQSDHSTSSSPENWETTKQSNKHNQRDDKNHDQNGFDDSHYERVRDVISSSSNAVQSVYSTVRKVGRLDSL